ncbi:MAG: hypothetical protein IK152_04930 [Lachnospiraceae bacterium]|nr:hypothetical protein [Lachnospiraceae bacterium]
MTLTSDILKKIINKSKDGDDSLNAFLMEISRICEIRNESTLGSLRKYLEEEYGISTDIQLRLASIDIKNDICDFVNSNAA